MDKDYSLVYTHELKANDLVRVDGAVLRLYGHAVEKGGGFDIHTFKTEVADDKEWQHAKRDLKDYVVRGDHLTLWARLHR